MNTLCAKFSGTNSVNTLQTNNEITNSYIYLLLWMDITSWTRIAMGVSEMNSLHFTRKIQIKLLFSLVRRNFVKDHCFISPIFDGSAESVNFFIILNFQRLKFLRNQSFQTFQRNRKFSWKEFAITNFGETVN